MKIQKIFLILAICIVASKSFAQTKPFELEKKWVLAGFSNPESIVIDNENNILYVSNVNGGGGDKDGNGFISKVSTDGTIINLKWVEGLNAPKGLVIYKSKLYVADINDIVCIDIATGKIQNRYVAKGSTFLNDVTADKKGNIYASNTFGFSAIYKLNRKGIVSEFIKDEALQMPNGLLVDGENLLVAPWGVGFDTATFKTKTPGSLLSISLKDKKIIPLSKPIGNLDGLEKTIHGYIITDWLDGKLYYWNKTLQKVELLDLPQGSADLEFDKKTKTIYIPLMNDNKIVVYTIK